MGTQTVIRKGLFSAIGEVAFYLDLFMGKLPKLPRVIDYYGVKGISFVAIVSNEPNYAIAFGCADFNSILGFVNNHLASIRFSGFS